jgi:phage-related protein
MQGFDVVGEVAKQSGKSREEIQKAGVTYEQTAAALKALTSEGGKYNGMLAKQMNTLGGVLKQFASLKAATAEAIGTGVSNELKDLLKYILQIGRAGQDSFVNVFVKAIKEVIHWIFQIIIMWKVLGYRIADMGDALGPVKNLFASLRDVAGDVLTGIMNLIVALGKAFLALSVPISAFLTPIIQVFGRIVKKVLTGIGEIIDEITPMFLELAPIFEAIGRAIGEAFEKILPVLENVKNAIIAAVTPIKAFLTPIIESLKPLYEKVFGALGKLFGQAEEGTSGLADTIKGLAPLFSVLGKIMAFYFYIIGTVIVALIEYIVWVIDKIKAMKAAWENIKAFFVALGRQIAGIFQDLWSGIVNTAMTVWDTLKSWFSGLVEGIKNIWNGIVGFFSGLWEAIMQGPTAAIEYIKNAFFGLFNSIQEKLFGFINSIKEGWEKVKGFFGNIGEGVVNFFTGGDSGTGGGQLQPAYAGNATQAAMAGAVGQTSSYAYNTMGGNSTVNAQTSINVNVPPGTPKDQSEAIARQINAQFDAKLAGSINSSRANIPSPEVRRH